MKILILGSGGSGKSTLARSLSDGLMIPAFHMDQLFWKPNWTPSDDEELKLKINDVVGKEQWILDGNYAKTINLRAPFADYILYLDRSTLGNLYRVLKRYFQNKGKVREDMPVGCVEKIDLEFITWILTFKRKHRKFLKQLQENYSEKILILKTKEDLIHIIDIMKESISK